MRSSLAALAVLSGLCGCHAAPEQPAPETNAAALEARLEQQANAMEAQADAAADRNAAEALSANADQPANATASQP